MEVPKGTESLIGRKFGRLTVIDYMGKNSRNVTLWLCSCDCGREKTVQRGALLNGAVWRCGRNCPYDTGMVPGRSFGALTLLHRLNDSDTQEGEIWLCECECGNRIEVTTRRLRKGIVTSCGCHAGRAGKIRDARGTTNDTALIELNDKPKANNTTGVRGVSEYADGRYHATITFRHHVYRLGSYDKLKNAKTVREEAERLIWGPAIESNGEKYPSHDECLEIVADIKRRYAEARIRHIAE